MRASLHAADLHYGGDLVLHTASSGSISHLSELYLRLDDGATVGIGEVRINIAYLNGYAPETVTRGSGRGGRARSTGRAIPPIFWRRCRTGAGA